jgi:diaminopimelate decarboxylase
LQNELCNAAAARQFATRCCVCSRATFSAALTGFQTTCGGHDVLAFYALEPNSNPAILNSLARSDAGFDISCGEFARVIAPAATRKMRFPPGQASARRIPSWRRQEPI